MDGCGDVRFDMTQLYDDVVAFVAKELGVNPKRIHPTTTLLGDLGCDGYDGYEFMTHFAEKFGVDMMGFDISRHFSPEGMWPWSPIVWLILAFKSGTPEEKAGLEPITVANLHKAAESRRWSSR